MTGASRLVKTGTAYLGNRYLRHAERDLDQMAGCCDYVVHVFSEADFYFHKESLAKIFNASRRRGLDVWVDPWGVGGVFGGEAFSKFLLDHPSEWQMFSDGRRVPAACLNSRVFRKFVQEWITTASQLGGQVAFWDEPHVYFRWTREWEGDYACVCPSCQQTCRDRFDERLPRRLNNLAREFRRWTIRDFLKGIMGFAGRKGMRSALCLYALEGYADYDRLWVELAGLPELDIFGCDPYWRWGAIRGGAALSNRLRALKGASDYVRYFSEKVLRETQRLGKESHIWIQAMRFPRGSEKEIASACQAAAQAGITHLAGWSYDGGALLDPVLSEDPSRVWAELSRAFRRIRKGR